MSEPYGAPTRRQFLGRMSHLSAATATLSVSPGLLGRIRAAALRLSEDDVVQDEDFWAQVQSAFAIDRSYLNLNNGGVSPSPRSAQEAFLRHNQFANQTPARNMWQLMEPQREPVRQQLAALVDADPEEVAICRNTTEALETVTFGLDLEPGDEIIATDQDYPRMVAAWKQRARRDGVVFTQVSFPTPPESAQQVIDAYAAAITPRTRLLHVSHIVFLTGEILPVKELCALAGEHGILSLVDGAHSFAHVPLSFRDLGCDFFGTSLHKWLCAPFGTGMLCMKRAHVPRIWPLFAADEELDDDIRRFEQIGTHPVALVLSIAEAVRFHRSIGGARKIARLRFLRDVWTRRLAEQPNIRFHTNLDDRSGSLVTVEIDGVDSLKLYGHLRRQQIMTSPVDTPAFSGVRVTPHLYTTLDELDRFCRTMEAVARDGLPA
jgi:selenocysteine lyase/cysteine desulfurase